MGLKEDKNRKKILVSAESGSRVTGIWKKAGISLLSVLLFFLCSGLLYVTKQANSIEENLGEEITELTNPHVAEEEKAQMGTYWTVALFGIDSRSDMGKGASSDAVLLCTVNRETGEIRLASVYRDTLLQSSGKEHTFEKLNQIYSRKGTAAAVMALNENLDLQVDDYVSCSWKAAVEAVNLLGGVDLEITKAEWAYINSLITETVESTGIASTHLEGPGYQHLDGVQAVAYARIRLPDTDFKRTERQRTVIRLLMEKAKNADWAVINQIMVTVLPQVETSIGMEDLLPLAEDVKHYSITETAGFPKEHNVAEISSLGGAFVLPATLESNVVWLHQFLYQDENYECSQTVKDISRVILKLAVKN